MKMSLLAAVAAGSLSLAGCATTQDDQLAATGAGAVIGGVAGAGVGALIGAPIEGAAIGAVVGGVAGAVWADGDNDGRADGYYRDGRYYSGTPSGYTSGARDCRSVLGGAGTGAAVGAAGGAGVGALVGGLSVLEGAIAGAVVGGIAGAIWTDRNNDGCVDGYTSNGVYYEGTPPSYSAAPPAMERG